MPVQRLFMKVQMSIIRAADWKRRFETLVTSVCRPYSARLYQGEYIKQEVIECEN
jgi:hypothetical protein